MDAPYQSQRPPSQQNAEAELHALFTISQMLDRSARLENALGPVLEKLGEHLDRARVALSLYDPKTDRLMIYDTYGLARERAAEARYRVGEGVTGQVYKTGKAEVIPNLENDPRFLNRALARDIEDLGQYAFICAPLRLESVTLGALGVLRHAVDDDRLRSDFRLISIVASLIAKAVDYRKLGLLDQEEQERRKRQRQKPFRPHNIIGRAKPMQEVYEQIEQVAPSQATVLLLGESGVGKELVAQAIHEHSGRSRGPFVRVNCAALPESILESELFGHEKGAFTGALRQRKGRFEQAQGGTLFLDEVGDFSPAIQVALLRVLQERELERVGGAQTIKLDVRIVAATNRDLDEQVRGGSFRQDLYYRLNVFPIRIPALRDRRQDIPLLTDHFIQKYSEPGREVRRISVSALNTLLGHHWPGNVRELENVIERAALVANQGVLRVSDLPPTLQRIDPAEPRDTRGLQEQLENLERELISDALIEARGNMAESARMLRVTERVMGLRVQKYGISPKNFRFHPKPET